VPRKAGLAARIVAEDAGPEALLRGLSLELALDVGLDVALARHLDDLATLGAARGARGGVDLRARSFTPDAQCSLLVAARVLC